MSGNQKQAPSGAPQQQRYAQGADGYHVTTPPAGFVQQQTSNQPSNQGPTIRGMAQSVPPNQSSTPPQNELKQMQQQQPGQMQMAYVRTGQPNNFYRTPPPSQGGPRVPNHHRQAMPSTGTASAPMFPQHMPLYPAPMAQQMATYQMQMPYNAPRPPYYSAQPYPQLLPGQYIHSAYPAQQPQAQQFYYSNSTPISMASRPPPQVTSVQQAGAQPTQQTMPMQQPMPPHSKKKQRAKAIPIINPNSGKEIFEEEESQPPSGESSARETPQPPAAPSEQQLISAEFAARVAIVASEDKEPVEPEPVPMHTVTYSASVPPPQPQHHHNASAHMLPGAGPPKENDVHKVVDSSVVQNSKLQASTKEFIPDTTKHVVMKESTTPVVSANTDGVEVTLHPKGRDRESPAKMRRQQQQQHQQQQQQHQQQQQQHQQQQQQQHQQQQQLQHRESVPKEIPVVEPAPAAPVKEVVVPVPVAVQEPEPKAPKPAAAPPAIAKVKAPVDNKVPATVEHRPPVVPQTNSATPVEEAAPSAAHAKSKGGAQKSKESTASLPVQQSSKPTMPVPGSQPPKPSSKANKLRELNIKGANKEGTDMDAFNTSEAAPVENCNSEPAPKEDVTEPAPPQPQVQQPPQPQPPAQQPAPPPQKLADVKTMPKHKVDVTSIVKDVPRPLKPVVPQPQPVQQQQPATDTQDETDRAVCEKIVQVKNETNNIKTNSSENSDTQVIDKTLLRYKKDQWSPLNTDGKKCYDRDFLICLQNNPKSKQKPTNLPDLEIVLKDNNRMRADPRSFSLNRTTEVLMPSFHKSSSQRGPLPKRNSQQGKAGIKGGKPNTIHVTLSLREDVKLRETENAWRPARQSNAANLTEYELKTAELYKKVRGVLNKLTPEKFDKLLNQVRALSIDNAERLQGVIDLVFEKAVDEPNFSVAYALMCKELALMQVPANSKNKDEPEFVNFRKLLITRCQLEFEKNSVDEDARNVKIKEIEECTDPEKKKELQLILEEDDRRMRVKSVGNIRFIGELFKQQMLTVKIMLRCINILLESKDEDSLECLCKLLTTIGKDLEIGKGQTLGNCFHVMQEIVDKKHGKISSRVRFMLQDVIDLRNSKWIPRRQDLNPKTMEQIQKEADTEQLNIQVMNSGPMSTPRKDDRMGGGGGGGGGANSDRKRRNNQTDDSGWSMATSRNRTPYTVESSKLMNKPPSMEEMTLGSKNLFGQWSRGSNIKTQPTHAPIANMYAALETISTEADKGRPGYDSRMNKDLYVSKGHSMERSSFKQNYEDGRGSRSGSQQRSAPVNQQPKPAAPAAPVAAAPPPKPQLNPEQLRLRMQNILEEYLNDCCTIKECESDIRASIEKSKLEEFVIEGYNSVLERSSSTRSKTGKLFAFLVKSQLFTTDELCKALSQVLAQADDLVIDIPKLWDYLAEMILPLVTEGAVPLDKLRTCCDALISQGHAHKLLAQLLKQMVADNGPNYVVDLWQSSGVRFTDFMSAESVDSYVKDHKLDFLMGGAGTPVGQGSLTTEQIHSKLHQFLVSKTPFDTITDWIKTNVGEGVSENAFIRTLVTVIVETSLNTVNNVMRLRQDALSGQYQLLQRYVDNQERLELQCLYALQALVHKLEHPPGLLLSIVERLWEDGLLSTDSFLTWEKCTDPLEQEGKGVALKSLPSLFTALKEAEELDEESGSSTSEEA